MRLHSDVRFFGYFVIISQKEIFLMISHFSRLFLIRKGAFGEKHRLARSLPFKNRGSSFKTITKH
jgi:hypothetical protein